MARKSSSPALKVGLILVVILIGAAKVRTVDVPGCSQEITRCLAACRAVLARRLTEEERAKKFPNRAAPVALTA